MLFDTKKESTQAQYIRKLELAKMLFYGDDKPKKGFTYLKKPNTLTDLIEGRYKNNNTKKLFFAVFYLASQELGIKKRTVAHYKAKMVEYSKTVSAQLAKNELKPGEGWATMKELRKLLEEIPENTQDYVIVALYTLIPPLRADYANLVIKKRKPRSAKANVLVNAETNTTFYLRNYKTSAVYKEQVIRFKGKLRKIIRNWLRTSKNKYLLEMNKKPMNQQQLSEAVRRIMKKYMKKRISINTIRHIWETELQNSQEYKYMSDEEKIAAHEKLLHSHKPSVAESYRKIV